MTIEKLNLLMVGIQTVVLVLSFGALIWQLKQIARSMRNDAYSRVIDDYSRITERLLESKSLSSRFYEGNNEFKKLSDDEQEYYNYIGLSAAFFERVYLLHRQGGIDASIWSSWERWIQDVWLNSKLFSTFWKNEHRYFTEEFARFVDAHLNKARA